MTQKGKWLWIIFLCCTCLLPLFGKSQQSQNTTGSKNTNQVLVMEIRSKIDPRMNRYVDLALSRATEIDADYVIIDMDTYGGALTDADEIRTRILEYDKPVYVFINSDAASAGALISIACDSIYMARGGSIGAATVVQGGTQEKAPDKYQSYMRSIMRSTAEANGRDPRIAEAMVDESLEVEGISPPGQVITFSTSEAIKNGYCEGQVASIEEILKKNNITPYKITEFKLSRAEKIIAFFLNPVISGVLILIIVGGIYFELQTPGVGFPILASAVAAILYFTPYYLNGLAENWEIVLFVVGIALVAAEIFVIPGFGIPGILGIISMAGSLTLVMVNNDFFDFSFVAPGELFKAMSTILAGLLGSIIIMFFGGVRLANSQVFNQIALQDTQAKEKGYTSNIKTESFVGKKGVTYTVLRPSGKVMIDDEMYDAYTRGNYIGKGVSVEVVNDEGTSLKVREQNPSPEK